MLNVADLMLDHRSDHQLDQATHRRHRKPRGRASRAVALRRRVVFTAGFALALAIAAAHSFAAEQVAEPVARAGAKPAVEPVVEGEVPIAGDAADANAKAIELSPIVTRLLESPILTDEERRAMAIFHGQWQTLDNLTIAEQAAVALQRFDLRHPSLTDASVDPLVRAEAAFQAGDRDRVRELVLEALPELAAADEPVAADVAPNAIPAADADAEPALVIDTTNVRQVAGALLLAEAEAQNARYDVALNLLRPIRLAAANDRPNNAQVATDVARALVLLARLEGRPAAEYSKAMQLLGDATGRLDRVYWPALVGEAELLAMKDNFPQTLEAVNAALSLNPAAGEAWFVLGRQMTRRFNFDGAEQIANELRKINAEHPLADLVQAGSLLIQKQPDRALPLIERVLSKYPHRLDAMALQASAFALRHDDEALAEALEEIDHAAPGSPVGLATVGEYLAFARQYAAAEDVLRKAIDRQPNWAKPYAELGLMLMQAGDDEGALAALRRAYALDPFHRQVVNQLQLADHLQTYGRIETEHFLIRYKPGIDEVLARDMARWMEPMHDDIAAVFEHTPTRKTTIELMPNERWFGVRIAGIPEIWTIAASTGPVIALTPPRFGAKQRGEFDWARVIRHEFVHTVTLEKTRNRIPHWFTEACAVWQEIGERDYATYQLLATAYLDDELFNLSDINWAFVRPKSPKDRPLAYAQAHWMLQYIVERWGQEAMIDLLNRFGAGQDPTAAFASVTGQAEDAFLSGFKSWAGLQVDQWGLSQLDPLEDVRRQPDGRLRLTREQLDELLLAHPAHPELLKANAMGLVDAGLDLDAAKAAVDTYAAIRPVDPWSWSARLHLAELTDDTPAAIAALAKLEETEQTKGDPSFKRATLLRGLGRYDEAAAAIERALHREPYNGDFRELAATINLQRGSMDDALFHLESMAILEPDQPIHLRRLVAIYTRLGRDDDAKAADAALKKMLAGDAIPQQPGKPEQANDAPEAREANDE